MLRSVKLIFFFIYGVCVLTVVDFHNNVASENRKEEAECEKIDT